MTNNPIRLHICTHCGTAGNGYITYDNGFEFNCYCCSKDTQSGTFQDKVRKAVQMLDKN